MQYYKGDVTEVKFQQAAEPQMAALSLSKDDMFEGCYTCYLLGDLIFNQKLSPLANAIVPDIFRQSFNELYESFTLAGTFESYLSVFRKVFGSSVDIEFTVPAPGKLIIDIEADQIELSNWVAKSIENNTFIYSQMLTLDGDRLQFKTVKGFNSQYELEQMLFEMVPAGVFTEINLTIL